jgi:hypothetical protein
VATKFFAVGSFLLRSRNLFVIVGDVVEGEVRAGMELALPLNGTLSVTGKISSIEYVDVSHQGRSYIGLALACDDPDELGFWSAMNISGETLTLT